MFGMAYGAGLLIVFATVQAALFGGPPAAFDTGAPYLLSLAYLGVFGSVLGFGAYLTLLGRIGADRAGYATVLFPVVALAISTVFEGYLWTPTAILGVGLVLFGNIAVLGRLPGFARRRPARTG